MAERKRFDVPIEASPIWSGSFLATPACPMTGNMAITPGNPEFEAGPTQM
jgi:hypothetical protein